MSKIRWGVLSTARIGIETVIPAMQLDEYCTITAIASRRLEKAQAATGQLSLFPLMSFPHPLQFTLTRIFLSSKI